MRKLLLTTVVFGLGVVAARATPARADVGLAQDDAVTVPLRLGIGAAVFGNRNDLDFAVRAPFELGLRLRRTPLEFYGEIALALAVIDPQNDLELELQGGIGFRLYF
jgi:hypothetical protein